MRNLVFLVFAVFSSGVFAVDLVLGNFNLLMSKEQIFTKMGKPIEHIEQADLITDVIRYPDLEFYFSDENLIGAYTDTKGVCAANNICVGSAVLDAIKFWGKPHPKTIQDKDYLEFYKPNTYSCWYRISGRDFIRSIEIACQP